MFWRIAGEAVSVAVKMRPGARRPGLYGTVPDPDGERLVIAVREPAEGGRANRAACAALADALGLPASAVEVAAGATARRKILRVRGNPDALAVRLAAL